MAEEAGTPNEVNTAAIGLSLDIQSLINNAESADKVLSDLMDRFVAIGAKMAVNWEVDMKDIGEKTDLLATTLASIATNIETVAINIRNSLKDISKSSSAASTSLGTLSKTTVKAADAAFNSVTKFDSMRDAMAGAQVEGDALNVSLGGILEKLAAIGTASGAAKAGISGFGTAAGKGAVKVGGATVIPVGGGVSEEAGEKAAIRSEIRQELQGAFSGAAAGDADAIAMLAAAGLSSKSDVPRSLRKKYIEQGVATDSEINAEEMASIQDQLLANREINAAAKNMYAQDLEAKVALQDTIRANVRKAVNAQYTSAGVPFNSATYADDLILAMQGHGVDLSPSEQAAASKAALRRALPANEGSGFSPAQIQQRAQLARQAWKDHIESLGPNQYVTKAGLRESELIAWDSASMASPTESLQAKRIQAARTAPKPEREPEPPRTAFEDLMGNASRGMGRISGPLNMIRHAGMGMMINGAIAAGGFIEAIKSASDFDAALHQVYAVAGERVDLISIDQMRESLNKLAIETNQTPKALAEGLYSIESAGLHGADALAALRSAALEATGGQTPLDITAPLFAKTFKAYNLQPQDAPHVADLYTKAVTLSLSKPKDFEPAMSNVLDIGHKAGLSLNELAAALSLITQTTKSAATGSTYLKNALGKLIDPTAKMKADAKSETETFRKTGQGADLSMIANDKAVEYITQHGFAQFIHQMQAASGGKNAAYVKEHGGIEGLANAEQLGKLVPDLRTLQAYLSLIKPGQYDKIFGQITNAAGATANAVKTQSESLAYVWQAIEVRAQVFANKMAAAISGPLRTIAHDVMLVLDWFNNLNPGMQSIIIKGIAVAGALTILTGALALLVYAFEPLTILFKTLGGAFGLIGDGTREMSETIDFAGGKVAFFGAGLLRIAGFVGIAIAAFDLLKTAWNNDFLHIQEGLSRLLTFFSSAMGAFQRLPIGAQTALHVLFIAILAVTTGAARLVAINIVNWLTGMTIWATGATRAMSELAVAEGEVAVGHGALAMSFGRLGAAFGGLRTAIAAAAAGEGIFAGFLTAIGEVGATIAAALSAPAVLAIIAVIALALGGLIAAWIEDWGHIKEVAKDAVASIGSYWHDLVETAKTVVNFIKIAWSIAGDFWGPLIEKWKVSWDLIVLMTQLALSVALNTVSSWVKNAEKHIKSLGSEIVRIGSVIFSEFAAPIIAIIKFVKDHFTAGIKAEISVVKSYWSIFTSAIKTAFDSALTSIENRIANSAIGQTISSWIGDIKDTGSGLVQLWNQARGITAKQDAAKSGQQPAHETGTHSVPSHSTSAHGGSGGGHSTGEMPDPGVSGHPQGDEATPWEGLITKDKKGHITFSDMVMKPWNEMFHSLAANDAEAAAGGPMAAGVTSANYEDKKQWIQLNESKNIEGDIASLKQRGVNLTEEEIDAQSKVIEAKNHVASLQHLINIATEEQSGSHAEYNQAKYESQYYDHRAREAASKISSLLDGKDVSKLPDSTKKEVTDLRAHWKDMVGLSEDYAKTAGSIHTATVKAREDETSATNGLVSANYELAKSLEAIQLSNEKLSLSFIDRNITDLQSRQKFGGLGFSGPGGFKEQALSQIQPIYDTISKFAASHSDSIEKFIARPTGMEIGFDKIKSKNLSGMSAKDLDALQLMIDTVHTADPIFNEARAALDKFIDAIRQSGFEADRAALTEKEKAARLDIAQSGRKFKLGITSFADYQADATSKIRALAEIDMPGKTGNMTLADVVDMMAANAGPNAGEAGARYDALVNMGLQDDTNRITPHAHALRNAKEAYQGYIDEVGVRDPGKKGQLDPTLGDHLKYQSALASEMGKMQGESKDLAPMVGQSFEAIDSVARDSADKMAQAWHRAYVDMMKDQVTWAQKVYDDNERVESAWKERARGIADSFSDAMLSVVEKTSTMGNAVRKMLKSYGEQVFKSLVGQLLTPSIEKAAKGIGHLTHQGPKSDQTLIDNTTALQTLTAALLALQSVAGGLSQLPGGMIIGPGLTAANSIAAAQSLHSDLVPKLTTAANSIAAAQSLHSNLVPKLTTAANSIAAVLPSARSQTTSIDSLAAAADKSIKAMTGHAASVSGASNLTTVIGGAPQAAGGDWVGAAQSTIKPLASMLTGASSGLTKSIGAVMPYVGVALALASLIPAAVDKHPYLSKKGTGVYNPGYSKDLLGSTNSGYSGSQGMRDIAERFYQTQRLAADTQAAASKQSSTRSVTVNVHPGAVQVNGIHPGNTQQVADALVDHIATSLGTKVSLENARYGRTG